MTTNNTTSIMLVTYNRLNLTQRTFDSLFKTTNSPYRLIVVDNGSTDGTVEWLKKLQESEKADKNCIEYRFSFNEKNMGIATGRNQCLKIANEYNDPWLSTLDNDVELPENWLRECIEILEVNKKFAIGVNFENVDYPLRTINEKTFQYKINGNLGTACTVFPRNLHELIGYFNTEYFFYAHEDADFGFRSRLAKYELGYLKTNGKHLGEGENDQGEYREFKNEWGRENLGIFKQNCTAYFRGLKPIKINF